MTFDNSKVAHLLEFEYKSKRAQGTIQRLASSTGILVERGLMDVFSAQGFDLNPDLDNKSHYNPAKQFELLGLYARKRVFNPKQDAFELAKAMTFKMFGKSKELEPLTEVDSIVRTIDGTKSSGAPFFTSKKEAFVDDLATMGRIKDGVKAPPPCVAYFRVQHGNAGPKQRLVWGYPQSMTLLESTFARPLIDHFLQERTPMCFGLRRHEVAARMTSIVNSGVRMSFDFSKFDASISASLIDFAFGVLRSHFNNGEEEEETWRTIIRYFIHTPIIMPDGKVYRKHGGVPSGSYFTQLIDSIVNYLAIQYTFIRLTGTPINPNKILVLGDDSVVGLNGVVNMHAASDVAAELGLEMNPSKCRLSYFGDAVHFLGHDWDRMVVDRPVEETVKRMVFPEGLSDIEDSRLRYAVRVTAYLADSTSAWRLLRMWDRWSGPSVRPHIMRQSTQPFLTGHLRLMGKVDRSKGSYGSDKHGYVGVLL